MDDGQGREENLGVANGGANIEQRISVWNIASKQRGYLALEHRFSRTSAQVALVYHTCCVHRALLRAQGKELRKGAMEAPDWFEAMHYERSSLVGR